MQTDKNKQPKTLATKFPTDRPCLHYSQNLGVFLQNCGISFMNFAIEIRVCTYSRQKLVMSIKYFLQIISDARFFFIQPN